MRLLPLLCLLAGLAACSDSDDSFNPDPPAPEPLLSAELRRTEYGIPHVKAEDWLSLGYGIGYAYAQDNFCVTMREIIFSIGRSAEFFGEENGGNLGTDLVFNYILGDRATFESEFIALLPQPVRELNQGFARGMNRYLEETGVENLATGELGCRNADWVFPIDEVQLFTLQVRQALRQSSFNGIFVDALLATEGPSTAAGASGFSDDELARVERQLYKVVDRLGNPDGGSNGLALGRDITQDGSGMLLGNPHQPWFGEGAWYLAHLTIPGLYDSAGALLHGLPFVGIGFNKDLAWTHTISIANRLSLYELQLVPGNPLQYVYGDEIRDITSVDVTVKSLQADGSLQDVTKTFYQSHFGPIINLKDITPVLDGWPLATGTILSYRDANLKTGLRTSEEWLRKAQATNLTEYIEAIEVLGNPVFHDLAADRNGNAFYGELSAIPFISQFQLDTCIKPPISTLITSATTRVLVSLDGSDPTCEWGTDPEAPQDTNIYGPSALPQLQTTDYVGNSNNSYWLSDANNPLTGFPTVMGPVGYEGLQQFLRTRLGHLMVEQRRQANDGISDTPLFTLDSLKAYMYDNRVHSAELTLPDVLSVCVDPSATAVQGACGVLAQWDRKVDLDSRGAQVWTEFWGVLQRDLGAGFQGVIDSDTFWRVDFDPSDPLNTPAGIDIDLQENRDRVVAALDEAQARLAAANVALDARWGDIQYLVRGAENVPIHGGDGTMGVYGAISARLQDGGYINPTSGNSYIQAVTWDESECPIADVILVPSQSTDPESPHFADQTKLYSNKEWVRFPFCEEEIEAAQIGETILLEEF